MNEAAVRQHLKDKDMPNLEKVAQAVVTTPDARSQVVAGIVAKDDTYRYNCFQVLLRVLEIRPAVLYPEWDRFFDLLSSRNAFHRSIGLQLIAGLAPVDAENRLDAALDRYLALLDDDKVMVARHMVQNAGQIVAAKPYLREQIVGHLLEVDSTHHAPGRKELIKGDVIEVAGQFVDESGQAERIVVFVRQQLGSESPRTRKVAREFLKR